MSKTVFCVEDDTNILEMTTYALKTSGFDAFGFSDACSFKKQLEKSVPNLILMDIMLPDGNGLKLLEELKNGQAPLCDIPIIMLTAKTSELDKVKGLDLGADDYITKPFGILELISRVKAVLRRVSTSAEVSRNVTPNTICAGGIELNLLGRTVTYNGQDIPLTFKEFELLHYLLRNRGKALTREEIMNDVWSFDYEGESRTVDMHIKSLRQKLDEGGSTILTVRGVGYKIQ
ncbi:MAG: response regulator transcription factor [Ruminococcaceae bacterium]|nr:response regulator transcription factor [Oscillospiraceae bacterium]